MFPVKHTVIYTFFAITSVQNTCFCSVFNALASKNPAKSCYVQCFFHFWPFFHCRKATKMTQNSISIPSCAQTPKNPRKMSKTPPYSGLGAKPFLGSGLGAKPFLGPPPPAKADIATAILTNVIEHLVLLLPPNKHAFTAKAVWADLIISVLCWSCNICETCTGAPMLILVCLLAFWRLPNFSRVQVLGWFRFALEEIVLFVFIISIWLMLHSRSLLSIILYLSVYSSDVTHLYGFKWLKTSLIRP